MAAENARESIGNMKVKIDVDVSEALTGLKAVQREAKKAAQALAELDTARKKPIPLDMPTAHAIYETFGVTILDQSDIAEVDIARMVDFIREQNELAKSDGVHWISRR